MGFYANNYLYFELGTTRAWLSGKMVGLGCPRSKFHIQVLWLPPKKREGGGSLSKLHMTCKMSIGLPHEFTPSNAYADSPHLLHHLIHGHIKAYIRSCFEAVVANFLITH